MVNFKDKFWTFKIDDLIFKETTKNKNPKKSKKKQGNILLRNYLSKYADKLPEDTPITFKTVKIKNNRREDFSITIPSSYYGESRTILIKAYTILWLNKYHDSKIETVGSLSFDNSFPVISSTLNLLKALSLHDRLFRKEPFVTELNQTIKFLDENAFLIVRRLMRFFDQSITCKDKKGYAWQLDCKTQSLKLKPKNFHEKREKHRPVELANYIVRQVYEYQTKIRQGKGLFKNQSLLEREISLALIPFFGVMKVGHREIRLIIKDLEKNSKLGEK